VLRDISLRVESGEVVVVCGPSGSGKSTLIRCVNRLERIQSGEITVLGQSLSRPGVKTFFAPPKSERTKLFLSKILSH